MKEQCFFVGGGTRLFDASCHFFLLLLLLLQLCIHSRLVVTMTLILKLMTNSPADMEDGSPGTNALSTLMPLHACTWSCGFSQIWQRAHPRDGNVSLHSPFEMRRFEAIYLILTEGVRKANPELSC